MGGEGDFPKFFKALCVVERGDVVDRVVDIRDPVERSRYEVDLGPDRLARHGPVGDAPAVGEGLDDEEAAPALRVQVEGGSDGQLLVPGVGHLDPQELAAVGGEAEPEVPAGYATVDGGVGGQLGDDVRGRFADDPPIAQMRRGQETGEPGAPAGGGEQHRELPGRSGMFGSGDVLVHAAQRGRGCVP